MAAEREFKLTFLGDSRKAQAAIGDLDKKMGGLGSKVSNLTGLTIGPQGLAIAMGGALVGGLVASAKATAAYADEVEEMSQRTGLSTARIQELQHAANLTGASIEGLEVGVRRMQSTLVDASNGMKSAEKAFDQLGLSAKDLIGLGTDEQLEKITTALADIEDPTLKAALAVDIFGRSGTDLLPMLADGAAGMEKMREEAHRLGIVMSEEDVAAAAELQDNLDRLDAKVGALQRALGNALIPVLIDVTDFFLELGGAVGTVVRGVDAFIDSLGRIPGAAAAAKAVDLPGALKEGVVSAIPGVSQAQTIGKVGSVIKSIGNALGFDEGGVVPGARGSAQLAVVHGGETILPTHKGGGFGNVTIHVHGNLLTSKAELQRLILDALHSANQRGSLGIA